MTKIGCKRDPNLPRKQMSRAWIRSSKKGAVKSKIAHSSKRQDLIERIRMKEKVVAVAISTLLNHGLSRCARCGTNLGMLWLDEITGRHSDEIFPSSVDPANHQLLCSPCHVIKTNGLEKGHHYDYLAKSQPQVKAAMVTFSNEIKARLPELPPTMKQRLPDILKAVNSASKVCYVAL